MLKDDAKKAAEELLKAANLKKGDVVVVGCSSSEVGGGTIGKNSAPETGEEVFSALSEVFGKAGVFIACQCCEHLNRAIIVEREYAEKHNYEIVNVVPFPKAGGSFATAGYKLMKHPVALEHIKADAGMDIGDTLIGMHLKEVAVPLRLEQKTIGKARVICARTRPKLIGGERAHYDEKLMK